MKNNDFILDGLRWSFSSVNTYNQCPQAFKYGYLDALPKINNAFSDWGTFMHSILERYFRGELEFFELSQVYEAGYADNIKCNFPPNKFCDLGERYYAAGRDYLDQFDGLFEDYNIIGVEQKVRLLIRGRPFIGVIDLLLEKDGEYIILDHKSKSTFKSKKELAEYARQLYLYAYYVHERFGKWPTKLIFHMIRNHGELIEIVFSIEDCEEAADWFDKTINKIYSDEFFQSKPNHIRDQLKELQGAQSRKEIKFGVYLKEKKRLETELKKTSFFCWQLCGSREVCPDSDKGPKEG